MMEDSMGKKEYIYMYGWVPLLYSRNWRNTVNQLYYTNTSSNTNNKNTRVGTPWSGNMYDHWTWRSRCKGSPPGSQGAALGSPPAHLVVIPRVQVVAGSRTRTLVYTSSRQSWVPDPIIVCGSGEQFGIWIRMPAILAGYVSMSKLFEQVV